MKVLIFGTSHAGMFIDAWNVLSSDYPDGLAVDFLSIPAPWLALELSGLVLPRDGVWRYKETGLVNYLRRSKQYGEGAMEFRKYDRVVFVDMFFCYDYAHLISGSGEFGLTVDTVPASRAVWEASIDNTLGRPVYRNHPLIGNLESADVRPFLRSVVGHVPASEAFLIPRPMLPAQRLALIKANKHQPEDVRAYATWFDSVASRVLADEGINYLARKDNSICPTTGATLDALSVGWLDADRRKLNEHMAVDYALPLLRQVLHNSGS